MVSGAVRAHGVSKQFGHVVAVRDADLCVAEGELLALLGPSGCGKTTLLRLIAGLERPDSGEIILDERIAAGPRAWVPAERRHVGFLFQDYALFPHLTAAENVGFGLPRRERRQRRRVTEVLDLVGLAGLESRYPHELSGGQQQRVALARALAPEPSIVLLDEPWSNIDAVRRAEMRDELAGILREARVTVLLVTHDREEAFSLADRIALMLDGAIVQAGSPEDIYRNPADRWTAEFTGGCNFVRGRIDRGRVETLFGSFPVTNANGAHEVDALLRPELLELRPDPHGDAEVVAREFRGHDVFYRVRLPDGSSVVSQRPSTELVPLGARVGVRAHTAPVRVFA
ncbi:MAG: ABC transporter ATP-binding protein [Actinomycetota bacterium]|nr:ABC transporter ATP-binding protein [Actinomycetota bacterium]